MDLNWETCIIDDTPARWAIKHVTMTPKGEIKLSRYTYELLNEPEKFELLFDRNNNTIGVRPTNPSARYSFEPHPRGRHGSRLIRAFRLCQQFGIRLPYTVRFRSPEIDRDGILRLDLRTAEPLNQKPRAQVEGQQE